MFVDGPTISFSAFSAVRFDAAADVEQDQRQPLGRIFHPVAQLGGDRVDRQRELLERGDAEAIADIASPHADARPRLETGIAVEVQPAHVAGGRAQPVFLRLRAGLEIVRDEDRELAANRTIVHDRFAGRILAADDAGARDEAGQKRRSANHISTLQSTPPEGAVSGPRRGLCRIDDYVFLAMSGCRNSFSGNDLHKLCRARPRRGKPPFRPRRGGPAGTARGTDS